MDAEHQQPDPPAVDRERDAHFLDRVDTALDRHRKISEPPPPSVHEAVIHAQAPTPDANTGVGSPAVATAPAGGARLDTLPKPAGSAAAPQFFGAGGSMMRRFDESTLQSRKASRPSSPPPAIVGIGNKVARPDYTEEKIVLAMVGLPARGKSYLSNKLTRYLQWLEYDVKVFNVGQLRRTRAIQDASQTGHQEAHTAQFFSGTNEGAMRKREQLAEESLEMLISWLRKGGNVAIHDATNSTKKRRAKIQQRIEREPGLVLIFLESVCDDPAVIAANIALKASAGDPDYKNMSREDAERDFINRIKQYEAIYETITEPNLSYLQIINVGSQVVVSRIHGYLQSRIAFYLMNLHLKPRSIFFSRHGESMYNVEGKIGGDAPLSPRGLQYARALPGLIREKLGEDTNLTVWTSTLQRTIQTAEYLPFTKLTWKSLDELDAGVCDGMTYEEIEEAYPEDFANRDDDKFNYRYRGGESYRDVVLRLEPVIMELERQENILIIGHQAILRCLYAYFHNLSQDELPYIKIPLHTVIKLTPKAYGCDEERYKVPINAVDTHRAKPANSAGLIASPVSAPLNTTARKYFDDSVGANPR